MSEELKRAEAANSPIGTISHTNLQALKDGCFSVPIYSLDCKLPADVLLYTAPPTSESALAESVLAWWDEHEHDLTYGSDGAYKIYSQAPAFVELAMKAQAVPFDGDA